MAASFDPSVIGGIGGNTPDVVGAVQRRYELKDLANAAQLRELQLNQARREEQEQAELKQLAQGADFSTQEGVTRFASDAAKINPALGMNMLKEGQAYATGQVQQRVALLAQAQASHEAITDVVDPVVQQASEMRASGKFTDADISSYIQKESPLILQRLREANLPAPVMQNIEGLYKQTGGAFSFDQLMQYDTHLRSSLVQITKERADLDKTYAETERARRETQHLGIEEKQNQEKINLQRQNAGSFGPRIASLMATAAEAGVTLPAGLRSKQQQLALWQGLLDKNPGLSDEDIVAKIKEGQISFGAEKKETQTAAGIGGRVSVAENELNAFAEPAIAASDAVPRGKFVPANKLLQAGERNLSDPDLKELLVRTQAVLNAYDVLASRGGTDKDKREYNRQQLLTADSPAAYKRAIQTMMDEARLAKGAARAAEGRGSAPANTAGWSIQPVQ